jgi:hypothetical protein
MALACGGLAADASAAQAAQAATHTAALARHHRQDQSL